MSQSGMMTIVYSCIFYCGNHQTRSCDCIIFSFRFGFVEFDSIEAAQESFSSMNGQEVDGRKIYLDFAEERSGKRNLN